MPPLISIVDRDPGDETDDVLRLGPDDVQDEIEQWTAILMGLIGPRLTANMLRTIAKDIDASAGELN